MASHLDSIRHRLRAGIATPAELIELVDISQPTLSRAIRQLGTDIVRIGAAKSIHYALRDPDRAPLTIYHVDSQGRLHEDGILHPVYPDGFVFHPVSGKPWHSDALPWWLYDMRPQGYLGRSWAARHAARLNLPPHIHLWTDRHILSALCLAGEDTPGHWLLGERMREAFLAAPIPQAIAAEDKTQRYHELAQQAASGEIPGSSVGGEQPKFTAYAQTATGAQHVIVKFSAAEDSPVSARWRDLLLAEHHALQSLLAANIPAAHTQILDHHGQRFLESVRFDRVGAQGRRPLYSLTALDLEFAGKAAEGWPGMISALLHSKHITPDAAQQALLLWAYGSLMGNSDMHGGNLSFLGDAAPFALAPAYDMTPMAFAPQSSGHLPDTLPPIRLDARISASLWQRALPLAEDFLHRLDHDPRFSTRFQPCRHALHAHLADARERIARLA